MASIAGRGNRTQLRTQVSRLDCTIRCRDVTTTPENSADDACQESETGLLLGVKHGVGDQISKLADQVATNCHAASSANFEI